MINAQRARRLADEATIEIQESHLNTCVDAILAACVAGKYEALVCLEGRIHPNVVRQLRNAGYEVHRSSLVGYKISWVDHDVP